tara:strand:+ start:1171 stop:2154 length:984 start_codon:yes stop_codon:yes gene_type:complete
MNKIERGLPFKHYQNYRHDDKRLPGLHGLVINSSSLSDIDEEKKDSGSAARFKWNHILDNREKRNSAPALTFGRAFHSYVLEPEEFNEEYVVEDNCLYDEILQQAQKEQIEQKRKPSEKFSKNLSAWKKFVKDVEFEGKELLPESTMLQIEAMTRSINNSNFAVDLKCVEIFNSLNYEAEISVFNDLIDLSGKPIPCKARLDYVDSLANNGDGLIVDLKSIAEWSPGYSIDRFKWYRQMAFYKDIAIAAGLVSDNCKTGWIFCEKSAPFEAHFHEAEDCLIEAGRIEYKYLLHRIRDCAEQGKWAGHGKIIYPHSLEKKLEEVQELV